MDLKINNLKATPLWELSEELTGMEVLSLGATPSGDCYLLAAKSPRDSEVIVPDWATFFKVKPDRPQDFIMLSH